MTDKIILVAPRLAAANQPLTQKALDYIADEINRLRMMGQQESTDKRIDEEYQKIIGAIQLLHHLVLYCDNLADARAEAAIAAHRARGKRTR
jgi:hypothetical protein